MTNFIKSFVLECIIRSNSIVIRPQTPVYSPTVGASLSMKVINSDYLVRKAKKG